MLRVLTAVTPLLFVFLATPAICVAQDVKVDWNFEKRLSDLETKVDALEKKVNSLTYAPDRLVWPTPQPATVVPANPFASSPGYTVCDSAGCRTIPGTTVLPAAGVSTVSSGSTGTVRTLTGAPPAGLSGGINAGGGCVGGNCQTAGYQARSGPVRRWLNGR